MEKISNYDFLDQLQKKCYRINCEESMPKRNVISTTCVYLPEKNGLVGKKITVLWSNGYVQSWTELHKAY